MNERELKGKKALVTGVSRLKGIGAAICKQLAREGADIYFTYWTAYDKKMPWGIQENEPEELQKMIRNLGVKCFKNEVDLSHAENVRELFQDVKDQLGIPDILVNNATYSTNNCFQDIEAEELDKHYQVNIRATTLLSSYFGRYFNKGKGGRIINLTSGQFQGPMPNEIAYVATKGGIDALTITLSAELAEKGITVNGVNPGPTDTGWMDAELKKSLLDKFPFGRIGQPEDAARLVGFLSSEQAGWITGQIINSEGGFIRS